MEPSLSCPKGFDFNQEICQCVSQIQCELFCIPPSIGDPIDNCACYSAEEYGDLYAHTKGADCLPGTKDDFKIDREDLSSNCESGVFDYDTCTCNTLARCKIACPPGKELDPRFSCKCEWSANIEKLYEHDLGDDCDLRQRVENSLAAGLANLFR